MGIMGRTQNVRHMISPHIGRALALPIHCRYRVLGCQFSEAEWVTMQQVSPLPARSALRSFTVNAQVKANL
jgi:hypothetical protein